jgi:crotonobetainyl-CoA:carnitine CoA-transferase CaiB-like acyl-CoA transferase
MRLDGVRVLDLTRLLPGPYATQLLADAGADVVKVEDTDAGDYARDLPPVTDSGVGAVFDAVNRGKRSVAVDLKTDRGREVIHRLAADVDVVVEGFRPGVVDRLGVDYETLAEVNEAVVYCSITGYGQDGPLADRVGHDLTYVGVAGLLDLTREDEAARPQIPGFPVADMAGGLFAAYRILGALLSRELGNADGAYLDVSLVDVVTSFSQVVAPAAFQGADPRPGETPLAGGLPWYDVYETADGRYVTLAALEPQFWRAFCGAVDREDLLDAHGSTDPATREALRAELVDLFAERTRAEWEDWFGDVDATVAPVLTLAEALTHPRVGARGLVERGDDGVRRVRTPVGASSIEDDARAPPTQGEHTAAILRELGYDAATIRGLADDGVILTPER